ncbi:Protein furry homolog-like [Rhizoctonia solani]|uniref:Protein furry homolog-like n=1 Tax=Rhizoctonia solani TaxID=456999 RepID=A0A0K6GI10_9AGAM|nr:Protein furry homolog-like [Rhizoctonia solani]
MLDSNLSQNPGTLVIRQWEEAGAWLASALGKYLDLCISLGRDSQKDGTPPKALNIRIITALESLHTQLEQQLDQSRSVLAQTRNQLQSPISHFPSEILSEIFSHVIFDPIDLFEPVPMDDSLKNIYQSLHNLLGVCSSWKNVVLARGSFWSIVPIIEPKRSDFVVRRPGKPFSTCLSLERSGNADLHLAAIPFEGNLDLVFIKHASRFRSINILSESIFMIGELLDHFLKSGSQLQVSELSLSSNSKVFYHRVPPERIPLSLHPAFIETNFESILNSLSVLRLSDITFDWSKVQFSPRLVEIELQKLTLGSDEKFVELLSSLSSATELRTLKLISVVTRPSLTISQNTTIQANISFPKLQTVVARNLFFNTLDILLSSIKSRSHQLTLHLTRRTFKYTYSNGSEPEEVPAERVADLFRQVTVNTLLLEAFEEGDWLSGLDIWEMLNVMPDIETLRMYNWDYPADFCELFERPNILNDCGFPRFKHMYLTQARIRDEEAFKNMVASYSQWLERMELAGAVLKDSEGMDPRYFLQGDEPIVAWFKENVPNFKLTSNYDIPLEFCGPVWQLWAWFAVMFNLNSQICYFPGEILSEIFAYVVFDPIDLSKPICMEESLTNIYQSVHSLLGVCSTWRNLILSRSLFWSIVPIIEPKRSDFVVRRPGKPLSTGLSLERSGIIDLHLAAIATERDPNVDFGKYTSQFSSINILSKSLYMIAELLDHFLKSSSRLQLSELSLSSNSKFFYHRVPPERIPLSLLPAFMETNFESILSSLSVLRLLFVTFDWNKVQFSNRLVELELRHIHLGSDRIFIRFLASLSSATELRTLNLISVVTRPSLVISQNTTIQPNISFPKLQTMVVRNLFSNTLDTLLSSIESRTHRLTLHLTRRTFEYTPSDDSEIEEVPAQRVVDLFPQVSVDVLLLEGLEEGPWLSGADMREMLKSMPDIETLRIHDWDYPTECCKMIQRPDLLDDSKFPRIKNMHLTQASIWDEEAFKKMVASYSESLERLELAGRVVKGSEKPVVCEDLKGEEPIIAWFRENVPNFELKKNYVTPVDFCDPVWQLW